MRCCCWCCCCCFLGVASPLLPGLLLLCVWVGGGGRGGGGGAGGTPLASHSSTHTPLAGFAVVKVATERSTGKKYACKVMRLPPVWSNYNDK